MPSQEFVKTPSDEFSILSSESLCLNDLRHARERSQEVSTVGARRPQRGHCVVQVIKVDAQLSSVHCNEYQHPCRIG